MSRGASGRYSHTCLGRSDAHISHRLAARRRPKEVDGQDVWMPDRFDPSAVGLMAKLAATSKSPTHLYPVAMVSWAVMPPPKTTEKQLGERRLTNFTGVGISACPEVDVAALTAQARLVGTSDGGRACGWAAHETATECFVCSLRRARSRRRSWRASCTTRCAGNTRSSRAWCTTQISARRRQRGSASRSHGPAGPRGACGRSWVETLKCRAREIGAPGSMCLCAELQQGSTRAQFGMWTACPRTAGRLAPDAHDSNTSEHAESAPRWHGLRPPRHARVPQPKRLDSRHMLGSSHLLKRGSMRSRCLRRDSLVLSASLK